MAEKRISFNQEMVWRLQEENKTATRRKIRPQPPKDAIIVKSAADMFIWKMDIEDGSIKPPYVVGDILCVCEQWSNVNEEGIEPDYCYFADTRICEGYNETAWEWKDADSMPEDAARMWLQVTGIRAERLHDMKLEDFLAEGTVVRPEAFNDPENAYLQAREEFRRIWESTVKEEERKLYGWAANPWVWVINFEQCEKPKPESNFKCVGKRGSYCNIWLRECIGWNNCKIKQYDVPCSCCISRTSLSHEKCSECEYHRKETVGNEEK